MRGLVVVVVVIAAASMITAAGAGAQDRRIGRDVKVTWFGHAAFRFESPKGIVILVDPWLDNPKAPSSVKNINRVDLILVTHGHADHVGSTVELAQQFGAKVLCVPEIAGFLEKKGCRNTVGMNKSGTVIVDGVKVTMVDARHTSSINDKGQLVEGGEAAGFVVEFENGFVLYHAGDTGLFGDMKLIAEMYRPELAMLPVGGQYTMGPREAAKACELMNPKHILPMHYGTFPALTGNPVELKKYLPASLKARVIDIIPGEFVY